MPGEITKWTPTLATIYFSPDDEPLTLLHEVGHALLGHNSYQRDIELLQMERDAWHKAVEISPAFQLNFSISDNLVQHSLDSYRDWLHARSTCIDCARTGVETTRQHYTCLYCRASWRVNDAKICALRRRRNKKTP